MLMLTNGSFLNGSFLNGSFLNGTLELELQPVHYPVYQGRGPVNSVLPQSNI